MAAGEAATFKLKVLGGFQLTRLQAPVEFPARKLACLLTYLVLTSPEPQS